MGCNNTCPLQCDQRGENNEIVAFESENSIGNSAKFECNSLTYETPLKISVETSSLFRKMYNAEWEKNNKESIIKIQSRYRSHRQRKIFKKTLRQIQKL